MNTEKYLENPDALVITTIGECFRKINMPGLWRKFCDEEYISYFFDDIEGGSKQIAISEKQAKKYGIIDQKK